MIKPLDLNDGQGIQIIKSKEIENINKFVNDITEEKRLLEELIEQHLELT